MRFATDAPQDSEAERLLQEIQVELPKEAGLPPQHHLTLRKAEGPEGASRFYVSLWVPMEQESKARAKLEAAGFVVD